MQKGREGEEEVQFPLLEVVRAGLKGQGWGFVGTGEGGAGVQGESTARVGWLGPSARGMSSPPQNGPPDSFPPLGHSSGPDSVPWLLLWAGAGWEQLRQPHGAPQPCLLSHP